MNNKTSTQTARFQPYLTSALMISCVCVLQVSALAATSLVSNPNTKVALETVNGRYFPVLSGRTVVAVQGLQGERTTNAEIRALDLQGSLITDFVVRIPEASSVNIRSVARSNDGWFAVSGYSFADDGRVAEFIDIVDSDGNSSNIIRTDPFVARSIVIAADGTLWATGNISRRKGKPADSDPAGGVLRHFDRAGKLLGSFFPESGLDDLVRTMQGIVAASHDRVGWMSTGNFHKGVGVSGVYVEIEPNGTQRQYPLPPIAQEPASHVYGMALTDDGSAFATGKSVDGTVRLFSLNRQQRSWEPVNLPSFPTEAQPILIGASGNQLAIWGAADGRIRFFEIAAMK